MSSFNDLKILVGISGGIAAYKIPLLVRSLRKRGAVVRVVLTESAKHFVSPVVLQALSGHPVESNWFDGNAEHGMGHVELARWTNCMVIAPATANVLARLATGFGDDLLTTVALATEAPIWICPAMNREMWAKQAVQRNLQQLVLDGFQVVGPEYGDQACGEIGSGRMSEPAQILEALALKRSSNVNGMNGLTVVVTAGPTFEPIDHVRFIGNHSSGKMGYAIAMECLKRGAMVKLVSGPVNLDKPEGVDVRMVNTAKEMLDAADEACQGADILFAVAAVGDFAAKDVSLNKLKKQDVPELTLRLTQNPDVVRMLKQKYPNMYTVGFAAESENLELNARSKFHSKNLNMVVANDITVSSLGFGSDHNQVSVYDGDEFVCLERSSKSELAEKLLDLIMRSYRTKECKDS